MWGNIVTEATFQVNFNVGFSNTKSDILIHLSQWQYWWWFWFVFLWSLYFMLIIRVVRFRTLKFQPRIVTSFRPHGKWGDLLVCLIPTLWCINILINSSFLLKLIEWQNETSLFTIRIRGKQWYWIYKFDVKDVADILSYGKNVGNNKLYFPTPNGLNNLDDYLHLIQLRASNVWLKKYWNVSLRLQPKEYKEFLVGSTDQIPSVPAYLTNKKNAGNYIYDLYNVVQKIRKTSSLAVSNQIDKLSRRSAYGEDYIWTNIYGLQTILSRDPDSYYRGLSVAKNRQMFYRFYDGLPEFYRYYDNIVDYEYTVFYDLPKKNYYEYFFMHKSYCSTKLFKNVYDNFYLDTFFKKYYHGLKTQTANNQVGKISTVDLRVFLPNVTLSSAENTARLIIQKIPRYSDYYRLYNIRDLTPNKRKTHFIYHNQWISEIQAVNSERQNLNKELFAYGKLFNDITQIVKKNNIFTNLEFDSSIIPLKKSINFDEGLRWLKRGFGKNEPLKLIKVPYNKADGFILKTRFVSDDSATHKGVTYNPYLVIKQKRYTLKKKILEKNFKIHNKNYKGENVKKIQSNFFLRNNVSEEAYDNLTKTYRFLKKNKKRNEMFSVVTARRLLRTKRTLVLPAHVNITAITNSYDVVHSWFIPGLGLKLDCIPGRATHHTFYADNVGFYYGQCAEICGRYHHHMPIRLCILPYDQFLVWWHHFGLPRLMYSTKNRNYVNNFYFRKYVW